MLIAPRLGRAVALLSLAFACPLQAQDFPANHAYVAASGSDAVLGFDEGGSLVTLFVADELDFPAGLAFGPDGLLYVSSRDTDRVIAFAADGTVARTVGADGALDAPAGLAFGVDGNLYVCSFSSARVVIFNTKGVEIGSIGQTVTLDAPKGIAFGPNGNIFVSSLAHNVVFEFDPSGMRIGSVGFDSGLLLPEFLAFGPNGHLFVAGRGNDLVYEFDAEGTLVDFFGGPSSTLTDPVGLTFGPDGSLFVGSQDGNVIVPFRDGQAQAPIGLGAPLDSPQGVAFSPARLRARLSGVVYRPGKPPLKHKENTLLYLAPGSRSIMLALGDDPNNADDLASIYGTTALVFHGDEHLGSEMALERLFQGAQYGRKDQGLPLGTLGLSVSGAVPGGVFDVRKAAGHVLRVGPEGGFIGRILARRIPD